jgi:hypothetical protein
MKTKQEGQIIFHIRKKTKQKGQKDYFFFKFSLQATAAVDHLQLTP